MRLFLATLFTAAGIATLCAQYDPPGLTGWKGDSPDKKLFAATRVFPTSASFGSRTRTASASWSPAMIRSRTGNAMFLFRLARIVSKIAWSPDSRFLVLTTVSAGGHSPWHYETYVYAASDRTLRYADEVTGLVLRPGFSFVGPHWVRLAVTRKGHAPVDDMDSPEWRVFDLEKAIVSMPKETAFRQGRLGDDD